MNGSKLRLDRTRDLGSGQVFFRRKLPQAIVLGGADYLLLEPIRRKQSTRCSELLIICEAQCGGWKEEWRGRFSAGSCRWDLGGCTVSIKPETVDRYTCLLSRKDEKRNILETPPVDLDITNFPSGIEFNLSTSTSPGPVGGQWTYTGESQSLTRPAMGICGSTTDTYYIFWREVAYVPCLNGAAVPPSGSGWVNVSNDSSGPDVTCVDDGVQRWARPPVGAWPFSPGSLVVGPVGGDDPASPDCSAWIRVFDFTCVGGFQAGVFLCLDSVITTDTVDTARTLEDALALIIERADCGLAGIRSDFFDWNAVGDAPGYSAGINYVTGQTNQVDNLCIIQKSDAIDPGASNPATIGELTFAELMDLLRVAFRCFWDIDDEGYLRIEHWSYWRYAVGLDLNQQESTVEPLVFESLGDEIPRIERAVWMEAQGRDFIGKDIVYDSPCATGETKEWNPGRFTTDITYVLNDPEAISKDGFVIIAAKVVAGQYAAIIDYGDLSGSLATNAPMSWANLQEAFWQSDRFLASAEINGEPHEFTDFLPTVKQEEASYRACCSSLQFDPRQKVAGALSRRLGVNGDVESESLDLYADRSTLVLRYAY